MHAGSGIDEALRSVRWESHRGLWHFAWNDATGCVVIFGEIGGISAHFAEGGECGEEFGAVSARLAQRLHLWLGVREIQ